MNQNLFAALMLLLVPFTGQPQDSRDSVHGAGEKQLLESHKQQADENYNAFKNSDAFSALVKYGELKEKIFQQEAKAEIGSKETEYRNLVSEQKKTVASLSTEITALKDEQGSLMSGKQKLARNVLLYFFIISGLGIFVFISRTSKARREVKLKNISSQQLFHINKLTHVAQNTEKVITDMLFSFRSVHELSDKVAAGLAKLKSMAVTLNRNTEDIRKAEGSFLKVTQLSAEAKLFSDHLEELMKPGDDKMRMTNLNKVIEESLYLSYHWILSRDESFTCTITKDLEKILPELNLNAGRVGEALFHFFNNAFQAVQEKMNSSVKSYRPSVSVTSRKLPRFVQVRIKDNGTGINEEIRQKMYEPFFSTKSPEWSAGLGLSSGAQIIKATHKGEIIIESEPGNGTDLIIRFPVNVIL